jgi:parallel beta-helix repeat protein
MSLKSLALALVLILAASSLVVFLPVKAQARTITVPDDYSSIQAAIDHANAGDTVFVHKGIYNYDSTKNNFYSVDKAIFIDKPLSLIGEDNQSTFITVYYADVNYYFPGYSSAIFVGANNVTISGFTIRAVNCTYGVRIANSNCKIIGNNISNAGYGIGTYSSNIIISNNSITNNGYGIGTSSSNSVIADNYIASNSLPGISAHSCSNVTVKGNSIVSNVEIFPTGPDPPHPFYKPPGGISIVDVSSMFIFNNNISDNDFAFDLHFNCSGLDIHNNVIARSNFGAFDTLEFPIDENDTYGSSVGTGNILYYNNFINNSGIMGSVDKSMLPGNVFSWDNGVVGNYWSDYNGTGSYVVAKDNVDHHPLTQLVDISSTAPSSIPITIPTIPITVTVAFVAVGLGLIVYFKKRKH